MFKTYFYPVLLSSIITVIFIVLFGTITMWLWNWLMPDIFGVTEISWIQALGLCCLTSCLFNNFITFKNNK